MNKRGIKMKLLITLTSKDYKKVMLGKEIVDLAIKKGLKVKQKFSKITSPSAKIHHYEITIFNPSESFIRELVKWNREVTGSLRVVNGF